MHEWGLVQTLLESVARVAAEHGATAVHGVHVRVGEASGVEPDLLKFAFETFREGTVCEGASLHVNYVPMAWACPTCGSAIAAGEVLWCESCGVPARMSGGNEIMLEKIDLEVDDV